MLVGILLAPFSVKPDSSDLAVTSAKKLDTLAKKIKICRKIGIKSLVIPIKICVVEKRNYTVLIAGINEFRNQISSYKFYCRIIVKPTSIVK